MRISKDHVYSIDIMSYDAAIFRNSILMLSVTL